MKKLPIVGVMGSGRQKWDDYALPLGMALAKRPVHLLTGGGYGVMQSVAAAFVSVSPRQGLSIGCIPTKEEGQNFVPVSDSYPNRYIELPIFTPLPVFNRENPDAINRMFFQVTLLLPCPVVWGPDKK